MNKKKLTSKEAAHYLGIKEETLRSWRLKKNPKIPYYQFLRFGSVMYKIEDLDEFLRKSRKE
jgi:hypothetical protein